MLQVQRRHQPPCKRKEWDPYRNCACPLFIRGTIAGKRIRGAASKYLSPDRARNLEATRDLALLWERVGKPVRPPESAPMTEEAAAAAAEEASPTIAMAIRQYIADAKDRGLAQATMRKKRTVFADGKPSLAKFAAAHGLRFVRELDITQLREWRSEWKLAARARWVRQKSVLGFLWFCERSGWFPPNYTDSIMKALGVIEVQEVETQPFTPEQYEAVLAATARFSDRPSIEKKQGGRVGSERIRAMTELMRWTGLRISDACTLRRDSLVTDRTGISSVMVRQMKTGMKVWCPVPPHVAEMLRSVPLGPKQFMQSDYFFWTGNGKKETVTGNWQRSFDILFDLADLRDGSGRLIPAHPHMLRDTFAVESIMSGMRVEDVSKILGHSSIKTTEKSYLPWINARQEQLKAAVVASWVAQGIVPKTGLQIVAKTG